MRFSNFLKKYFTFNRRERNGLIVLSSIIIILVLSAIIIRSQKNKIEVSIELPTIDSSGIENEYQITFKKEKKSITKNQNSKAFIFDPNTVSEEEALELGLSPKAVKVLLNFRGKGGVFKEKSDFKKIYGVSERLYTKLEPYILIENQNKKVELNLNEVKPKKTFTKTIIELNSADSIQLVGLNGIGPKLSSRILNYRKSLGGFHNVIQLKEIYGMKDSLMQLFINQIEVDISKIKKIKINSIPLEELRKHTYIKFNIAQSIINYRQKHGNFKNESDLMKVGSISEEQIIKISPYIDYN